MAGTEHTALAPALCFTERVLTSVRINVLGVTAETSFSPKIEVPTQAVPM
ncbi:hypothetical protein [Leptospira kmetyi]